MFSILILTQDEELNLAACLASISWCDDIWILDSGSTDRTLEIAAQHGCHILHRKFDNFGDQRNYAIDNAQFKYKWVFDLDADERFTPELKAECEKLVRRDEKSAYYVANKMILLGKWIKHASQYPVYQMRFHKLGEIRFVPHGHGQREGSALRGLGYCKEAYIHYNFSKGLGDWFQKHAKYALREAQQQVGEEEAAGVKKKVGQESRSTAELLDPGRAASMRPPRGGESGALGDRPLPGDESGGVIDAALPNVARRRRLKRLVANLPGRSWLKFFYLMIVRGGIFDGPAGWLYCRMQAHYEFMCTTILKDLRAPKLLRDLGALYRDFDEVDAAFAEDEAAIKHHP